jgi:enterochelin esterase-like enzyme
MPGRIAYETITSAVLATNPLGDPATRTLPVYLPPSYDSTPDRRYPVVWMLSGFLGRGQALLNDNFLQPSIQQQLDRLIAEGMPPIIMALPDCITRYGGSQYINSTATGRYADHLRDELIPFVDQHFRTTANRNGRAIMGKSSGGYGALIHAMQRPDLFGAVACHSGDMYFEWSLKPDFPKFLNRIARNGYDPAAFFQQFERTPKKSSSDIAALNVLAMAACYSPNPAASGLPIDFPFDLHTGEIKPDVWARWLDHDPIELVQRYAANLRQLRFIFVDCGTRDEYNLHYGARILSQRLAAHNITHEHQEFDDDHRSTWYRYDVSLPKLAAVISGE